MRSESLRGKLEYEVESEKITDRETSWDSLISEAPFVD